MKVTAWPKVSVVLTAYNAERYIAASVAAALAQTYANLEVLVFDDGSSDATGEICRAFTDPRFRYIASPRIGRCRALNTAVSAAAGEYIAINDADDLSLPGRVSYEMGFALEHKEVAYVATRYFCTDEFHGVVPPAVLAEANAPIAQRPAWTDPRELYRRNLFNNSTLLYPKTTWQRIGGYDEALGNSEAALLPARTVLWYTNPQGFFKQKSRREHHRAIGVIRRRAHRLLGLPPWLKLYHPAWLVAQRCPQLVAVTKRLGSGLHGSRVRTP
jgi:glycosyltransferase involved in cell wall biosynthesis